jgi:hypothetical protein
MTTTQKKDDDEKGKAESITYLTCPNDNHPHLIDLGLPSGTKWACCNVGAKTPEDYGGYYAWGETTTKSEYNWNTYKYGYYNRDNDYSHLVNIGSDIAGTKYDVAHVQWCSSWVMPSQDQIKELCSKCSYIWTIKNNSGGVLFTGPSGATIFLPEVNEWREGRHNSAGRNFFNDGLQSETDPLPDNGYYWSSTPDGEDYAWNVGFSSNSLNPQNGGRRHFGQSVRLVR